MPSKKWREQHKKPCPKCGKPIAYTSSSCRSCRSKISYTKKICLLCGSEFKPASSNQRYCGNPKDEKSCSYWAGKEWHAKYMENYEKTDRYKEMKERYWWSRGRFLQKGKNLRFRFQILQRYNFTCQYCGRSSPEVVLEIDHRYPRSKGGLSKIENYIVACRDCNIGKGDIILNEFL